MPLLDGDVRSDPDPVEEDGVDVELPVDGDVVRGEEDGPGFDVFGLVFVELELGVVVRVLPVGSVPVRGVVRSPGVEFAGLLREVVPSPGVLRDVVPSPGVDVRGVVPSPGLVPGVVLRGAVPSPGVVLPGVRWLGIRPSGVLPGVRPSPAPDTRSPAPPPEARPSAVADADADADAVGVGVLRGAVDDVGLGVEAGPDPVAVAVPDALAEAVLAAPELGVGLLGLEPDDVVPPDELPTCGEPPPLTLPPVDGATGDVGIDEPPSGRPPPADGSLDVGVDVGAALVCVGALAARLSTFVLMPPPCPPVDGVADVPPDDAEAATVCGVGDDRPETDEPPPEWEGPETFGPSDEPPESAPPEDELLGEGSSKSDSVGPAWDTVGRAAPESAPDPASAPDPESDPESEPGPEPTSGAPMVLPPVSADIPPPMFAPESWPPRVDAEESEPSECDPEPDEESEPPSLPEPSEPPEPLDPSELVDPSDPLDPSEPSEPSEPSDECEPPSPSPELPCPSIRLSIAWCARCPAFSPRLSRTPSARVCGVCLMASQPAFAPCLAVVARS
ncbi:hypothetical protein [Streptomyces panaciradicis]|uniref:hypothetical protein n=1 Tax=Streptomyces panaciradicis TaxID=1470261 RepID=UPI00201D1C07|nr:hypothetical protein [Streptomyces panaciradicis]MCL6672702.1 hypothetical protein [Streptomyces panaciradicis]